MDHQCSGVCWYPRTERQAVNPTINTGGPAFPANRDMRHNPDWDHEPGMTLRDYFAAKTLSAIISGSMADGSKFDHDAFSVFPKVAYLMADAMLKARQEKQS